MTEVVFTPLHPWALPPDANRVDRAAARAERDTYRNHFRYKRITRLPVDCPPWVMGQELGWLVPSPVSVTLSPVDDIEFDLPESEELRAVGRKVNRSEMWRRGDGWIATGDTDWMRLHDFATPDNGWESMFLPNGAGTVEWRLGWGVRIPERYFLLVVGIGVEGLDVPAGVLPARTVNAMADRGGVSVAIRPTARVPLSRGAPFARLVLLHPDSLQASGTVAVEKEPDAP